MLRKHVNRLKKFAILVGANLIAIVLTIAIYAIGFTYDKAHQIYPESVRVSYDVSLGGVYGERWYRLMLGLLCTLGVADAVIVMIFLLRRSSK